MFEVSDSKTQNVEYFEPLQKSVADDQTCALFYKYFKEKVEITYSKMEFQTKRPITNAYKKARSMNAKNYMKFISHIVTDMGICYTDDKDKVSEVWVKYKGDISVCIKQKLLYSKYTEVCTNLKYTTYSFDKFINNITTADTGIQEIIKNNTKCVKIDKFKVKKWLEYYRNEESNEIEVYDEGLVENLDDNDIGF